MAVYRVQRTRDYTVMSNYHLKDKGLTLKSKGLLSMILSLPEEWNYTTRGLASICKEGVDAIGSALKELETAGYIVRRQLRGANGRITDTEYIIYEQPQPKKLDMLPSDVVSPDTENPDIGMITHTEDGAEAFADMTVNLPGYSLDPGEAFISGDISKDLLRFIKENKLGKVLPYQVQSGYGKYSAVAFDLEKLKAFDPKGVAEFREEWNLPDKKPVKKKNRGMER